jgi:hypothetical protein
MKCYRVLYSPKHLSCWDSDPVANSSHHRPPCAWIAKWDETNSKDAPDQNYPLLCHEFGKNVKFTASAREAFLANPDEDYSQCLMSEEAYKVGELDGVCAFTSFTACLAWVSNNPGLTRDPSTFDYVAFKGDYVSDAPEEGGIVAKVLKKENSPMKLDEFERLYRP